MSITPKTIASFIDEQKAIEEISCEVGKVLHYYEEHPQYPLGYNKIGKSIHEVNERLMKLRKQMQYALSHSMKHSNQ